MNLMGNQFYQALKQLGSRVESLGSNPPSCTRLYLPPYRWNGFGLLVNWDNGLVLVVT